MLRLRLVLERQIASTLLNQQVLRGASIVPSKVVLNFSFDETGKANRLVFEVKVGLRLLHFFLREIQALYRSLNFGVCTVAVGARTVVDLNKLSRRLVKVLPRVLILC